jgi:hypothetical protein
MVIVTTDAARPAADVVLGVVGHDPQHPRPHRSSAAVRAKVAVDVDHRILQDVLRFGRRPADHCSHT